MGVVKNVWISSSGKLTEMSVKWFVQLDINRFWQQVRPVQLLIDSLTLL
jgi:hypothetical protein